MADEVLLARFKADLDDLRAAFEGYIDELEKAGKKEKEHQAVVDQTAKKELSAAEKRKQALRAEEAELKRLRDARKQAFSASEIDGFNKKIEQSRRNISLLKGETTSLGSQFKNLFAGVGAGIAAAFSVSAVIAFGKASVNAFLEAQENAEKLRFAITAIGGEGEAAFERLIKQSERLQKTTVFSDDAVQQAQTMLSQFGLTAQQIEELIPLLADFASSTKQDITSAANVIGSALQGAGKELKKFGIDVSANKTELENLSTIMEGLAINTGAAAKETETLAGQLKQQANEVDNLQESVGSRLAPAWVAVKKEIFLALQNLIEFGNASKRLAAQSETDARESLKQRIQAEIAGRNEINQLGVLTNSQALLTEELKKRKELQADLVKAEIADDQASVRSIEARRVTNTQSIAILADLIKIEKEHLKQQEQILTAEKLRGLSIKQLNTLLVEQGKLNGIIADSNIKLINRELEARLKANEKAQKDFEKKLQERIDAENKFQHHLPPIELEVDVKLPEKLDDPGALEFDPIPDDKLTAWQVNLKAFFDDYGEHIQRTKELIGELTNVFDALFESNIQDLEREKEKSKEVYEAQTDSLDEQLENRRISEGEYQREKTKLSQKQIVDEKKIDKEIRKIKRQQAKLDKANAIFEATINTAVAVTEQIANPILAAVIAALGAAQVAAIVATPLPAYKKGTKGAKKSSMSLVGEEGPELHYVSAKDKILPAGKTRMHGKVIDAMFDGDLDGFINRQYVLPALQKKQKEYEHQQARSFAENITNSIIFSQGLTDRGLRKALQEGLRINNLGELAPMLGNAYNPRMQ